MYQHTTIIVRECQPLRFAVGIPTFAPMGEFCPPPTVETSFQPEVGGSSVPRDDEGDAAHEEVNVEHGEVNIAHEKVNIEAP